METRILGFDPERCQAPAPVAVSMGEKDLRYLIRSVLSMTTDLIKKKRLLMCLFVRNCEKKLQIKSSPSYTLQTYTISDTTCSWV